MIPLPLTGLSVEQEEDGRSGADAPSGAQASPEAPICVGSSPSVSPPNADLFGEVGGTAEIPAPKRRFDLRTEFLKERYKLAEEWEWYAFEVIDYPAMQFTKFMGGIYPFAKTRGKHKGRTDYKRPVPGSELTVVLSEAEFQPWLLGWERRTGKCWQCEGTGQKWAGWHHKEGNRYRDCPRCGATGIPPTSDQNQRQP